MKNIEHFYTELKSGFEKIDQLELWDEYDWSGNGHDNSFIMTGLAKEISKWNLRLEYDELSRLFEIIEHGFTDYDKVTSSMLATDFLVTIMEIENKLIRDAIKKIMGTETQKHYRYMLQFYREF